MQKVIAFLDRYDPYKGKGGLDSAVTDVWKHAGLPRTAPWLLPPGLPRTATCPPPGNLGRRRHAEERARTNIPRPCGNPRCLRAVACLLAAFLAGGSACVCRRLAGGVSGERRGVAEIRILY